MDPGMHARTVLPRSSALKEGSRHFIEIVCYYIFINFFQNRRLVLVFVGFHFSFLNIEGALESVRRLWSTRQVTLFLGDILPEF